eukprot:746991-Hanusia_phi.AAC.7
MENAKEAREVKGLENTRGSGSRVDMADTILTECCRTGRLSGPPREAGTSSLSAFPRNVAGSGME